MSNDYLCTLEKMQVAFIGLVAQLVRAADS